MTPSNSIDQNVLPLSGITNLPKLLEIGIDRPNYLFGKPVQIEEFEASLYSPSTSD
jgi:hypothetical protein